MTQETTLPAEFEAWLQTHCDYDDLNKSEIELARDAWQAAIEAALQGSLDKAQDDPLQPAANWLFKAIVECKVADIRWALRIGHNRAQRLFDHARRVEGEGK